MYSNNLFAVHQSSSYLFLLCELSHLLQLTIYFVISWNEILNVIEYCVTQLLFVLLNRFNDVFSNVIESSVRDVMSNDADC